MPFMWKCWGNTAPARSLPWMAKAFAFCSYRRLKCSSSIPAHCHKQYCLLLWRLHNKHNRLLKRAWFLCSEDYDMQGDKAWQWNEWELLSLKAAENDAAWKDEIRKFWDGHLPVFLSLEGGYAYYAISIKEGSIVYGSEPSLVQADRISVFHSSLQSSPVLSYSL